MPRVLITGGGGFVGANLAVTLADRHPGWEILAFDNLRRRGSELNLSRLRDAGVTFVHGDVRSREDVLALTGLDAIVECSAEPSVLAGVGESPDYLVQTNLVGAYHCLELARREAAQLVFLSTSRVYPVKTLEQARYAETATRFELAPDQGVAGLSEHGVAEDLPLDGARTLYGTTKLSAELLIAEYAETYGLDAVVDRCGVIAGPWQLGKVDQGVFTFWLLAHRFGLPLRYIGYGGAGKQVRDLLHVDDLVDLVDEQLGDREKWAGRTLNVGGGREVSLSLKETTELCRELTGTTVEVPSANADRPGDLRIYLSDCRRLFALTDWRPRRDARTILADTLAWIDANERSVREALLQ
ncbi:MAG TPA: NAD-dependent epimerase/dehydratase family protein [Solirubrobacteraceae bacterium]|nr:NAD-dependent epimerase/dehydratase family protein [Solirubrobacteraceae bacterium]